MDGGEDIMRLGKIEIPDEGNNLSKMSGYVKTIYDTYASNTFPKDDKLMMLVGYTKPSGSYDARIRALRNYGLLEGRGTFRVTDLGKQSAYGPQRSEALFQAFLNVWKLLYDKYRFELPRRPDWVATLAAIAGCEAAEAAKIEKYLRGLFEADANFIRPLKTEQGMGEELTPPDQQLGSQSPSEVEHGKMQFIEVKAGPYYSRMPYTEVGRDSIKTFLDSLMFEAEPKKTKKEEK